MAARPLTLELAGALALLAAPQLAEAAQIAEPRYQVAVNYDDALWSAKLGEDEIDLARLQKRDAVGRIGRLHFQLDAQALRHRARIVDIETDDLIVLRIDEAERRIAVERRDAQHAGFPDVVQPVRMRGIRSHCQQCSEHRAPGPDFHW